MEKNFHLCSLVIAFVLPNHIPGLPLHFSTWNRGSWHMPQRTVTAKDLSIVAVQEVKFFFSLHFLLDYGLW